ncbi:MAG: GNAT family N-acetyltransferase [Pseudomonadota bacterium]
MEPVYAGCRPGVAGEIVRLHALYYAREWGFGAPFQAMVANELSAFLAAYDPHDDLFLNAFDRDTLLGSITIDRTVTGGGGAHLRWFIVSEAARGRGIGSTLMARAMAFCDARGVARCWLTTFAGLDPARRLYERHGFRLTKEQGADRWQGGVREQLFERIIKRRDG